MGKFYMKVLLPRRGVRLRVLHGTRAWLFLQLLSRITQIKSFPKQPWQ